MITCAWEGYADNSRVMNKDIVGYKKKKKIPIFSLILFSVPRGDATLNRMENTGKSVVINIKCRGGRKFWSSISLRRPNFGQTR